MEDGGSFAPPILHILHPLSATILHAGGTCERRGGQGVMWERRFSENPYARTWRRRLKTNAKTKATVAVKTMAGPEARLV